MGNGELGILFPDEVPDLSLNLPASLVPPEQVRDMRREAPPPPSTPPPPAWAPEALGFQEES